MFIYNRNRNLNRTPNRASLFAIPSSSRHSPRSSLSIQPRSSGVLFHCLGSRNPKEVASSSPGLNRRGKGGGSILGRSHEQSSTLKELNPSLIVHECSDFAWQV